MKWLLTLMVLGLMMACTAAEEEVTIDWVLVEGGSFLQGEKQYIVSPKNDTIEGFTSPRRTVEVSDFYLSRYEITVAEFKTFCDATGRTMPEPPVLTAYGDSSDYTWQDDMPMLATWYEAQAFAEWVGGRLPTEAEWEYAAKGGRLSEGYHYSGSDTAHVVGWVFENADSLFHPVGLLKPNELGLYDMTGNLSEWVSDWYHPEMDSTVSLTDPQGPPAAYDSNKISKGTGWFYRSVSEITGEPLTHSIQIPEVRYQSPRDTRSNGFGFRVAKEVDTN